MSPRSSPPDNNCAVPRVHRTLSLNRRVRLAKWLTIICVLCCPWAARADDLYDVGISSVDITPDYPIRLNGFGNRRAESEGVSQPIFAKAIAISTAEHKPLVLVTLDSLGIRSDMVDEVARRLLQSHQLPRQNLAVTFSHSHCTPKVNGACDNIFSEAIPDEHQQHIDRYTSELTDHVTSAARQALDSRRPARLAWAVGNVKFAKNRRTVGGPVDHDLPMLVVLDEHRDRPRAVYVSYACHCVTLSFNRINGDWAGYAAAMIERRLPGATALVSIGAGSDQNPISGVTGDQVQVAEAQGVEIATEVERLLAGELRPVSGRPESVLTQIPLPLNKRPTREELQQQTGEGRPTDRYNAVTQLARLDRGEELLSQIDYPVQTWTFGDSLCMTFLAGEVCVDYALRLKQELDRERFWLNTYSNDFCCYIPSERLVKEGGYGGGAEVPYFALPATLKAGLESLIIDEVHRQVPQTFRAPQGTQGVPPKDAEQSLQCLQTHTDLQVLLAAAEPNVTDPVAIDFGADGRLWVAEMNDYGRGVYESFAQSGRIRWLRDADQDGTFETAHTFADGLRFPTDVKVWRDGVLICDAPDILYAEDKDRDGTADSVRPLFSGFEVRNAQARVNSLRFGLDNWVYGAGGLFGGNILSHQTGQTVDCSNRDFRINPDTGVIEAVSGRTQQGRCRNDWGDWFGCSNGTLIRAIAADDAYVARNPFARLTNPPGMVTDAESHRLYAPENLVTFELSGAPGKATAACGLGIYRDVVLGPDFIGDAFTCEPVHQSVHRIDFRRAGHGWQGRRGAGEEMSEFLSSTDRWFRPVQARTGPDGALWIVDMYRYVIEHSRWIPQSTLAELDVYAGRQRGRIYRIVPRTPPDAAPRKKVLIPDLTSLTNRELATKLNSSNGPVRDLAHQMLLWRSATDADVEIRQLLSAPTLPTATIHALAVLQKWDKLQVADLTAALKNDDPEVIRFALRLSEPLLSISSELQAAVFSFVTSSDVRVRRQVALSAGADVGPDAVAALTKLMGPTEPDAYVRSAALNSVRKETLEPVLQHFLHLPRPAREDRIASSTIQSLVGLTMRLGDSAAVNSALQSILPMTEELPTGTSIETWVEVLNRLDERNVACDPAVLRNVRGLHLRALTALSDADSDDQQKLAGLKLLGRRFGRFSHLLATSDADAGKLLTSERAELIAALVSPKYSKAVQRAAVEAVAATGSPDAMSLLLSRYASLSSEIRLAVVDAVLSRKGGPAAVLAEIEADRIRPEILDAARRSELLTHADESVRSAAERVLGATRMSNRTAVVESLLPALELEGSAARGRTVFRRVCSSCHRLEDQGHVVGPELRALTNRDPRWLLTTILDPNKDVDGRYILWKALDKDGRTASGMIVEETADSIRLRESGGKEHVIARSEIEEFSSTQRSVMPEGLERDLSAQDLSDVIAYISSMETPARTLPGNRPRTIAVDADGFLSLTADAAEIRGGEITFESPFANIGLWHHQSDTATWKLHLPQPGQFDVYLNVACATGSAGNQFRIDGLPTSIVGTVSSTGGWDRYRQVRVGTTSLSAGDHIITVRPDGPVRQALFDLREVRLVTAGRPPGFVVADLTDTPLPRYPPEIAPFLLDESQSPERRQKVIDQRPGMGPDIISIIAAAIPSGDIAEEYRRIPWIWRVAMAVSKRNDGGEIRDLLEVSVPTADQPLRDWQAVVIGGGLINGASQLGIWPKQRLEEILSRLPQARDAWPRTLQLAAKMADNDSVRSGTRYDALRMVALRDDQTAVPQLLRYLSADTPQELQMGAVSGLTDVDSPDVIPPLIEALAWLGGRNRALALEGLLRTPERAAAIAESIRSGRTALTKAERKVLAEHPLKAVRQHYAEILKSTE